MFAALLIVNIIWRRAYGDSIAVYIFTAVFIILLLSVLFFSSYIFGDVHLNARFGLFVIRIKYEDIRLLRENKESHALYIIVLKNEKVYHYLALISKSDNAGFVKDIRSKNREAIYELFDKNAED